MRELVRGHYLTSPLCFLYRQQDGKNLLFSLIKWEKFIGAVKASIISWATILIVLISWATILMVLAISHLADRLSLSLSENLVYLFLWAGAANVFILFCWWTHVLDCWRCVKNFTTDLEELVKRLRELNDDYQKLSPPAVCRELSFMPLEKIHDLFMEIFRAQIRRMAARLLKAGNCDPASRDSWEIAVEKKRLDSFLEAVQPFTSSNDFALREDRIILSVAQTLADLKKEGETAAADSPSLN